MDLLFCCLRNVMFMENGLVKVTLDLGGSPKFGSLVDIQNKFSRTSCSCTKLTPRVCWKYGRALVMLDDVLP
jgi:hypothetical protein